MAKLEFELLSLRKYRARRLVKRAKLIINEGIFDYRFISVTLITKTNKHAIKNSNKIIELYFFPSISFPE